MPTILITWYFYGLAGLGGWVIIFLISLVVLVYVWLDSLKRSLMAWGWRISAIVLAALILPSVLFRFTVSFSQFSDYIACVIAGSTPGACVNTPLPLGSGSPPLAPYYEIIFYLGFLGCLINLAVAMAYYINFRGLTTPVSVLRPVTVSSNYSGHPQRHMSPPAGAGDSFQQKPISGPAIQRPIKPLADAWLVSQDGRSFQLFLGETSIGRSAENDVYITGDSTISKHHAKITEQSGAFRLIDLGSTNGTRINGHWIKQPVLLEVNDEIQLGDRTIVRFVTAHN